MKEKKDSLILTKVLQETPVYVSINQNENVQLSLGKRDYIYPKSVITSNSTETVGLCLL